MAFTIPVKDLHRAELIAFERLAGARVEGSEWFAIHPQDAHNLLQSLTEIS